MIVHGERRRIVHVRAALERLAAWEPGVDRLFEAGDLACGLLDWSHARRGGIDEVGELEDAAHALVLAAARGELLRAAIDELGRFDLPGQVEVSAVHEGFAQDALDPDRFARAARGARLEVPAPDRVIGVRSIGLPLAAAVTAALGPGAVLTSVRPVGERHRRALSIGPRLRERLGGGAAYAVVDEGPGLSGSTFAAVRAWLGARGVPADRIVFFPGHGGEPPDADPQARQLWRATRRYLAEPDLSFLTEGADAVDDLAGGRWRYRLGLDPADWPPADARLEQRKLIVERSGRQWLCKLAGLGAVGRVKAGRARQLAAARLHPAVGELHRGYLAIEWHDGARPLGVGDVRRPELISRLAEYLAARRAMPASDGGPGAGPEALAAMAVHNAGVALGSEAARAIERRWPPGIASGASACGTDGRMHRWEWIALPDGRLLKTDAVDHALGHDLIGEQDIAWDLAGAAVEHALDDGELEAVRPGPARPELEGFYRVAYASFQLGLFTMAASLARESGQEDEAARLAAEVLRYRSELSRLVAAA